MTSILIDEESPVKSAKFWRACIQVLLLITFLIVFWPEVGTSWAFLWLLLVSIISRFPWLLADPYLRQDVIAEILNALTPQVVLSLSVVLSIAVLYLSLFLVSIFLVAQFVLPIQLRQDRWPAAKRLFFYWVKFHGAALFIREGRRIERPDEAESTRPGVVLVDLNSAIVIEKQPFQGKESDNYIEDSEADSNESGEKSKGKEKRSYILDVQAWAIRALEALFKRKKSANLGVRASGPGLIFTERGERITGEVDLRKQIRVQPGVHAYTRDGIKVTTNVIAIFTLGEKEDSVYVAYIGGTKNADNLRFIQLDPDKRDPNKKVIKSYEMHPDEKEEIDRAYQKGELTDNLPSVEMNSPLPKFSPPYHFDPERVAAAVYARSYNVEGKDIQHWTDLPLKVATEILRNNIARVTYDYLYSPENQSNAPLKEFKANLARTIRHQGVMSYKFVEHKEGKCLEDEMEWNEKMLNIKSARLLPGSNKLLRDYGIKIIHAAFGELKPDEGIRHKLMENWMAQWEKEIETIKAENELKAVRIKNNARAQAQLDMASNLSRLFKTAADSPQAMALRVFHALEMAATDPSTSHFLPKNVFSMLQSLHSWLLKERKKKDEHPHHNQAGQKLDNNPDDS